MSTKNILIFAVTAVLVIGGGYLISQRTGQEPSEEEPGITPTAMMTTTPNQASPTLSPLISKKPSPTKRPSPSPTPESEESPEPSPSESPTPIPVGSSLVSYTNSGYEPAYIEVEAGTVVTFVNDSTSSMWPASNNHPTHSIYPGSGITKCDSSPETIFDACKPIQPGESWSFKFEEKGTWQYHDHLLPQQTGIVLVK